MYVCMYMYMCVYIYIYIYIIHMSYYIILKFNMLTVLTLLPIEIIGAAIMGEGGPMYFLSKGVTEGLMGSEKGGALFESPTKVIVGPASKLVISLGALGNVQVFFK